MDIPKRDTGRISNNDKDHERKHESDLRKSAIPPAQKCATTNNTTNKETIKDTIEPPAPLLAGGQAPAALEYRKKASHEVISNTIKTFGKTEKYIPMPEKQFRENARMQIKAIQALK